MYTLAAVKISRCGNINSIISLNLLFNESELKANKIKEVFSVKEGRKAMYIL
jgi:hypothetical protein